MCNWIKSHFVIIVAILTLLAVIVVPLIINESYKTNEGYITVWGGSDVLAYFGAVVSAVGTIILGVVAWKQNTRLLKLEESTFLAANAGSALLTEVTVAKIGSLSVNFENHEEQIVFTDEAEKSTAPLDYGSVEITCKLEPLSQEQHVALVNVKSIFLAGKNGDETKQSMLFANNGDKGYTRVAISKEFDRFKFSLIMSRKEKQKFVESINDTHSVILMEVVLSLMTDKYVATELKCRATLKNPDYDENEGIYSHFKIDEYEPPICFWQGAEVMSKQKVLIKSVTEDTING